MSSSFDVAVSVVGEFGDNQIDYFEKVLDEPILRKVVEETNRYAEQNKSKNWVDITINELPLECLF